jgi:hypothetical protein
MSSGFVRHPESEHMMSLRTITLMLAIVAGLAIGTAAVAAGRDEPMNAKSPQRVVIDGVARYQVNEPLFECVRVVLTHRGAPYSADYLQGISGAAFRIAGICPCAPTCSVAMETQQVPKLLGYDLRFLTLASCGVKWEKLGKLADLYGAMSKKPGWTGELPEEKDLADPDLKTLRNALVVMQDAVKEELRHGRPVVLWHAFTNAEYDVVTGYDDATGEWLGFGSYGAKPTEYAHATRFRTLQSAYIGGWPSAILIGNKTGDVDLRALEIAALREAVKHARSEKNADQIGKKDWVFLEGLHCYENWIVQWGKADKKRDVGDAYCYGVYRDTHRAAAGFLREIAPRYPAADTLLRRAADSFQAEADVLKEAGPLLGWAAPAGPDAARNKRVVELLQQARRHYAAGIEGIAQALAQIDKSVPAAAAK